MIEIKWNGRDMVFHEMHGRIATVRGSENDGIVSSNEKEYDVQAMDQSEETVHAML